MSYVYDLKGAAQHIGAPQYVLKKLVAAGEIVPITDDDGEPLWFKEEELDVLKAQRQLNKAKQRVEAEKIAENGVMKWTENGEI